MIDVIKKLLENKWTVPITFILGLVFWAAHVCVVGVCIFTVVLGLTLFLCDDIKPVLAYILYVPFYIEDLANEMHWGLYIPCAFIAVFSMMYFLIKSVRKSKKAKILKKGKMFYPFVVASIVMFLGGIIGNFDIWASLIISGLCWVVYLFYFMAINFTDNLLEYLLNLFIIGSIAISVQMLYLYFMSNRTDNWWVGAHGVNTAAIYLMLGIISAFKKGTGSKNDWLYLILACVFTVLIVITRCRFVALITAPLDIFLFVLMVKKSPKVSYIVYVAILLILITLGTYFMLMDKLNVILGEMFDKPGLGGRDVFWPWCLERFSSHPIFGYGFMCEESMPFVRNVIGNMILAHNTVLQWMTSTGIVGSIGMMFFYTKKYIVAFSNYKKENFYIIVSIIAVALTGFFDQAAAMDFFIFLIPMLLVAVCEKSQTEPKE